MSTVTGTVIMVDLAAKAKSQAGATYDAWKLIYTNDNGETKDITKHANSLKFNAALKAGLQSLSPGDRFNCLMEKNDKGFLDVKSIEKGDAEAMPTAPKTVQTTRSNYETPEERANRQVMIVRQSSLANAINYYELLKMKPDPEQVLEIAGKFEQWVLDMSDKEVE